MEAVIYALCALTSCACAWLLLRSYARTRHRLLLWSGLCFVGMVANNLLLIMDNLIFPATDLATWRLAASFVALLPLLYGLIWEHE